MNEWMTMSKPTSTPRRNHRIHTIAAITVTVLVMLAMASSVSSQTYNRNRNKRLVTHTNSEMRDSSVFIQLPYSNPPTVKAPPYYESNEKCPREFLLKMRIKDSSMHAFGILSRDRGGSELLNMLLNVSTLFIQNLVLLL